ncbi:hypothetical protein [Streptomyces sp. NPDC058985]|uniref:hypothetical protein n=1 Tax=Streptomyces sp. NPDC058985 TaxID=3346684 RepID=UPI003676FA11
MDASQPAAAPIYDRLIAERGDAVAVAARTVEQTRRKAAEALDFSSLTTGSVLPPADDAGGSSGGGE